LISQRTGVSLSIKGVCELDKDILDRVDAGVCPLRTTNSDDIIGAADIDIVIELIGGINPAKEIILKALKNKKHVVTANKALLSDSWREIFTIAGDNHVQVNFEASVGGAIPIIRALRQNFVGNNIHTIYGILNGTTNYILTEMSRNGCSFDEALSLAQHKGYAESDPELDISGKDSAHKLAILSLISFGRGYSPDEIYTEGITRIDAQDLKNAEDWGYSIKLLAIAKNLPGGIELRVHPTLLPAKHILSEIDGSCNAVFVKGDLFREALFSGPGAGQKPTASSVIGDVVDIARNIAFTGKEYTIEENLGYNPGGSDNIGIEGLEVCYYLRFTVIDKPGVLAGISSVLAENNISIASVSQEERNIGAQVPVVILTHKAREGDMRRAIDIIDKQQFTSSETVMIRIEES
jgi:homoserine dehydrogenase